MPDAPSAGEVVAPVLEALQLRARDATVRNATSSRSHAVVKLRLLQSPAAHDEPGVESTLFLVDLAGGCVFPVRMGWVLSGKG